MRLAQVVFRIVYDTVHFLQVFTCTVIMPLEFAPSDVLSTHPVTNGVEGRGRGRRAASLFW